MLQEDRLDIFLVTLLAEQPEPPRRVHLKDFLAITLLNQRTAIYACLGLVSVLFAVYLLVHGSVLGKPVSSSDRVVSVLCLLLTCIMFGAPLIGMMRMRNTLRFGTLIDSVVLNVSVSPRAYPGTFDAMKNGEAIGLRRVYFSSGGVDIPFRIDRAWAGQIKKGSRIEVLADPARKKILLSVRLLPDRT